MPPKIGLWSRVNEYRFANALERRPALWNLKCPEFGKTDIKDKLWDDLAKEMGPGFNRFILKKRYTSIRRTYLTNLKKVQHSQGPSTDEQSHLHLPDSQYKPKWPLFDHLHFLSESYNNGAELRLMYPQMIGIEVNGQFQNYKRARFSVPMPVPPTEPTTSPVPLFISVPDYHAGNFMPSPSETSDSRPDNTVGVVGSSSSSPGTVSLAPLNPVIGPHYVSAVSTSDSTYQYVKDDSRGIEMNCTSTHVVMEISKVDVLPPPPPLPALPPVLQPQPENDTWDHFGSYIAAKLRGMNPEERTQRAIAISQVVNV